MAASSWITTYWPPQLEDGHEFDRVYAPNSKRRAALRLRPGDHVFVYETLSSPTRVQREGEPEKRRPGRPGRGGLVARLVIDEPAREHPPDRTLYNGRNPDFRFAAAAHAEQLGWVPWSSLRSALGWREGASPRGLELYSLKPEQVERVAAAFAQGAAAVGAQRQDRRRLEIAQALADERGEFDPENEEDARKRMLAAIAVRRGGARFRAALLAAYESRCAISGCDCPEALEAAHIAPYRGDHTNRVDNGLLLRADLHLLFDRGLLSVDSRTWRIVLHPELRGTSYAELDGAKLRLPRSRVKRPSSRALDRHRANAGLARSGNRRHLR